VAQEAAELERIAERIGRTPSPYPIEAPDAMVTSEAVAKASAKLLQEARGQMAEVVAASKSTKAKGAKGAKGTKRGAKKDDGDEYDEESAVKATQAKGAKSKSKPAKAARTSKTSQATDAGGKPKRKRKAAPKGGGKASKKKKAAAGDSESLAARIKNAGAAERALAEDLLMLGATPVVGAAKTRRGERSVETSTNGVTKEPARSPTAAAFDAEPYFDEMENDGWFSRPSPAKAASLPSLTAQLTMPPTPRHAQSKKKAKAESEEDASSGKRSASLAAEPKGTKKKAKKTPNKKSAAKGAAAKPKSKGQSKGKAKAADAKRTDKAGKPTADQPKAESKPSERSKYANKQKPPPEERKQNDESKKATMTKAERNELRERELRDAFAKIHAKRLDEELRKEEAAAMRADAKRAKAKATEARKASRARSSQLRKERDALSKLEKAEAKREEKIGKDLAKERARVAKLLHKTIGEQVTRRRKLTRTCVAALATKEEDILTREKSTKALSADVDADTGDDVVPEVTAEKASPDEPDEDAAAAAGRKNPFEGRDMATGMLLLSLWDFFRTFRRLVQLHREPPTLDELCAALNEQEGIWETVSGAEGKTTEALTGSAGYRLFVDMALSLVRMLLPEFVRTFEMTRAVSQSIKAYSAAARTFLGDRVFPVEGKPVAFKRSRSGGMASTALSRENSSSASSQTANGKGAGVGVGSKPPQIRAATPTLVNFRYGRLQDFELAVKPPHPLHTDIIGLHPGRALGLGPALLGDKGLDPGPPLLRCTWRECARWCLQLYCLKRLGMTDSEAAHECRGGGIWNAVDRGDERDLFKKEDRMLVSLLSARMLRRHARKRGLEGKPDNDKKLDPKDIRVVVPMPAMPGTGQQKRSKSEKKKQQHDKHDKSAWAWLQPLEDALLMASSKFANFLAEIVNEAQKEAGPDIRDALDANANGGNLVATFSFGAKEENGDAADLDAMSAQADAVVAAIKEATSLTTDAKWKKRLQKASRRISDEGELPIAVKEVRLILDDAFECIREVASESEAVVAGAPDPAAPTGIHSSSFQATWEVSGALVEAVPADVTELENEGAVMRMRRASYTRVVVACKRLAKIQKKQRERQAAQDKKRQAVLDAIANLEAQGKEVPEDLRYELEELEDDDDEDDDDEEVLNDSIYADVTRGEAGAKALQHLKLDDMSDDDMKALFVEKNAPIHALLYRILACLQEHPDGKPYAQAVDPEENPQFYKRVMKPLALRDIQRDLLAADRAPHEYVTDIFEALESVNSGNLAAREHKISCVAQRLLFEWVVRPILEPQEETEDDEAKDDKAKRGGAKGEAEEQQEGGAGEEKAQDDDDEDEDEEGSEYEYEEEEEEEEEEVDEEDYTPTEETLGVRMPRVLKDVYAWSARKRRDAKGGQSLEDLVERIWKLDDSLCPECGESWDSGDVMLLCDRCDMKWHMKCLPRGYKLDEVPSDEWFCPACLGQSGPQECIAKALRGATVYVPKSSKNQRSRALQSAKVEDVKVSGESHVFVLKTGVGGNKTVEDGSQIQKAELASGLVLDARLLRLVLFAAAPMRLTGYQNWNGDARRRPLPSVLDVEESVRTSDLAQKDADFRRTLEALTAVSGTSGALSPTAFLGILEALLALALQTKKVSGHLSRLETFARNRALNLNRYVRAGADQGFARDMMLALGGGCDQPVYEVFKSGIWTNAPSPAGKKRWVSKLDTRGIAKAEAEALAEAELENGRERDGKGSPTASTEESTDPKMDAEDDLECDGPPQPALTDEAKQLMEALSGGPAAAGAAGDSAVPPPAAQRGKLLDTSLALFDDDEDIFTDSDSSDNEERLPLSALAKTSTKDASAGESKANTKADAQTDVQANAQASAKGAGGKRSRALSVEYFPTVPPGTVPLPHYKRTAGLLSAIGFPSCNLKRQNQRGADGKSLPGTFSRETPRAAAERFAPETTDFAAVVARRCLVLGTTLPRWELHAATEGLRASREEHLYRSALRGSMLKIFSAADADKTLRSQDGAMFYKSIARAPPLALLTKEGLAAASAGRGVAVYRERRGTGVDINQLLNECMADALRREKGKALKKTKKKDAKGKDAKGKDAKKKDAKAEEIEEGQKRGLEVKPFDFMFPDADVEPQECVCEVCGLSEDELCNVMVEVPTLDEWLESGRSRSAANANPRVPSLREVLAAAGLEGLDDLPPGLDPAAPPPSRAEDYKEGKADLRFVAIRPEWRRVDLALAYCHRLPVLRGSHCAHMWCVEQLMQSRRQLVDRFQRHMRERACIQASFSGWGKTQLLGLDRAGRQYWSFPSDAGSVFVSPPAAARKATPAEGVTWACIADPVRLCGLVERLRPNGQQEGPLRRNILKALPEVAFVFHNGGSKGISDTGLESLKLVKAEVDAMRRQGLDGKYHSHPEAPAAAPRTSTPMPRNDAGLIFPEVFVRKGPAGLGVQFRARQLQEKDGVAIVRYISRVATGRVVRVDPQIDVVPAAAVAPATSAVRHLEQSEARQVWSLAQGAKLKRFPVKLGDAWRRLVPPAGLAALRAPHFMGLPHRAWSGFTAADIEGPAGAVFDNLLEVGAYDSRRSISYQDTLARDGDSIGFAKLALLCLEAALPEKAVDPTQWTCDMRNAWVAYLMDIGRLSAEAEPIPAEAHKSVPQKLMECLVVLESMLVPEALDRFADRAISALLPSRWHAVTIGPTLHGVYLRLMMLDTALLYDNNAIVDQSAVDIPGSAWQAVEVDRLGSGGDRSVLKRKPSSKVEILRRGKRSRK